MSELKGSLYEIWARDEHIKILSARVRELEEALNTVKDATQSYGPFWAGGEIMRTVNKALTPAQEQALNNPAAQFAGRMESVLGRIIFEHPQVSLFRLDAPTHCHNEHAIWDESGLPCEWCKLWDEANLLLADIQKAKEE